MFRVDLLPLWGHLRLHLARGGLSTYFCNVRCWGAAMPAPVTGMGAKRKLAPRAVKRT